MFELVLNAKRLLSSRQVPKSERTNKLARLIVIICNLPLCESEREHYNIKNDIFQFYFLYRKQVRDQNKGSNNHCTDFICGLI